MEKSIVITIMIDSVELKYLDEILTDIESSLDQWDKKRITLTTQDEQLVPTYPR